jgi:hypothetical protein
MKPQLRVGLNTGRRIEEIIRTSRPTLAPDFYLGSFGAYLFKVSKIFVRPTPMVVFDDDTGIDDGDVVDADFARV